MPTEAAPQPVSAGSQHLFLVSSTCFQNKVSDHMNIPSGHVVGYHATGTVSIMQPRRMRRYGEECMMENEGRDEKHGFVMSDPADLLELNR